jgi:lipopolysaccharide/colanic/teichoic acid biosynthesis glycosyltransferase
MSQSPETTPTNASSETVTIPASHLKKNLYPAIRHVLLIVFVLLTIVTILFLMHQNGKSIYEHGI